MIHRVAFWLTWLLVAYASIDWHDFVIVETVEFTEADDQMDLPPPMSLSELENMSLAQKRMNAMIQPAQEEKTGDVEMDVSCSQRGEARRALTWL